LTASTAVSTVPCAVSRNHLDVVDLGLQRLQQLDAAHPRHHQIGDDDRRPEGGDLLERVGAIGGFFAVNPQARTSSVRPLRVAGSSSTISTRSAVCDVSATVFNLSFNIDQPTRTIPDASEAAAPPPHRPQWPTWLEILLCSGYPTQIVLGKLLVLAGMAPWLPNGSTYWYGWVVPGVSTPAFSLSSTFVFVVSVADTVVLLR
jgi:hypothetical protein